jgi:pSer/pThr/pTyr-binding forkhead associated (FHA) protein
MELEYGGRRYPVAAGGIVIGSGPDAGLAVDAPGVRPRHALVRLLKPGMAVVTAEEPGADILVNGSRLGSDPTPLMHGDKLVIGGAQIAVSDPDRAGATRIVGAVPPSPGTPKARLVSLADGREYPVEAAPFVIGREASSHLVVESDLVSRRHAEILRGPGGDSLVDLSGNGVSVNGRRITAPVLLREGDLIRIGETDFRYHLPGGSPAPAGAGYRLGDTVVGLQAVRRPPPMPEPAPAGPAEPLATLLVKRGQRKGERLPVRGPVVNIGRGEFNDIALPDASISANHAKLQLKEGIWVLTDLGSTNGSRVDGEAVRGDVALSPGVQITLGEVLLLFEPRDRGVKRVDTTAAMAQPSLPGAEGADAISRRRILILALAGALLLAGFLLLR